jgi:hypothetical protein
MDRVSEQLHPALHHLASWVEPEPAPNGVENGCMMPDLSGTSGFSR